MEVAETATKILMPDLSELAVSIVAELIDVRYKENYSDAARSTKAIWTKRSFQSEENNNAPHL